MRYDVEIIAPERAEEYLASRSTQRPLSEQHARTIATAMSGGRFVQTGEAIHFNIEGHLINGQHRMRAIVISGISAEFLVVRDLPVESFAHMDQGKRRSSGDTLASMGFSRYNEAGQLVRIILGLREGSLHGRQAVDNSQVRAFAERNREHLQWTTDICYGLRHVASPGMVGAVLFLAGLGEREKVEEFVKRLDSGVGLNSNDPELILRNRLIKMRTTTRRGLRTEEVIPLVRCAWNAAAEGRKITALRHSDKLYIIGETPNWREELFE